MLSVTVKKNFCGPVYRGEGRLDSPRQAYTTGTFSLSRALRIPFFISCRVWGFLDNNKLWCAKLSNIIQKIGI